MTPLDLTTTGAAPTAKEPTKTKAEIANEQQEKAAADAALLRKKYTEEQAAATAGTAHEAKVNAVTTQINATLTQAGIDPKTGEPLQAPVEKYCATCGLGSHRLDWQKTTGPVYCDDHAKAKPLSTTGSSVQGLKQTDTGIKLTSPDQPVTGAPTTRPSPTPVTPGPPTNVADKAAPQPGPTPATPAKP